MHDEMPEEFEFEGVLHLSVHALQVGPILEAVKESAQLLVLEQDFTAGFTQGLSRI